MRMDDTSNKREYAGERPGPSSSPYVGPLTTFNSTSVGTSIASRFSFLVNTLRRVAGHTRLRTPAMNTRR